MKYICKVLKYLSIVCYVVIVLFAIIEIPMLFGYKPEVVLTGSMKPTYPVGSVIYYKESKFENISKDDVITFNTGDSIVTHRIVDIDSQNKSFTTKGDANTSVDINSVDYTQVLGKVSPICLHYAGYFVSIIQNNIIIVITIASILILRFILYNKDYTSHVESA